MNRKDHDQYIIVGFKISYIYIYDQSQLNLDVECIYYKFYNATKLNGENLIETKLGLHGFFGVVPTPNVFLPLAFLQNS